MFEIMIWLLNIVIMLLKQPLVRFTLTKPVLWYIYYYSVALLASSYRKNYYKSDFINLLFIALMKGTEVKTGKEK